MLFAPAIIVFAATGAMQTFGLHEAKKGDARPAPIWIVRLAEIHKNQRLIKPLKTGNDSDQRPTSQPPSVDAVNPRLRGIVLALKSWIVLMAAGIIVTTVLGIYMALKYKRDNRIVCGMLLIGAAVPVALLLL